MPEQSAWQHTFQLGHGKPIVVEPSEALLTSDAGLPPIRVFDEQIGLTEEFAGVLQDGRLACQTVHPFLQMLRQRVYGILAGYEDQNDHDALRSEPVSVVDSAKLLNQMRFLDGYSSQAIALRSADSMSAVLS